MEPDLDKIKESLISIISPMLNNAKERKLLRIRIEFSKLPHIDAAHAFDNETGNRWIVLNSKVFTTLHQVNDRFCQLINLNNNPHAAKEELLSAFLNFPDRIAGYFLRGKREPALKPGEAPGNTWVATSAQQIFLTLHELGHVFLEHGRTSASDIGSHVSVWHAQNARPEEVDAVDLFAASHMAKGPWPTVYSTDRRQLLLGIFRFFESLELLRKMDRYSIGPHIAPRERFINIAGIMDRKSYLEEKPFFDDCQSMLDDMYSVWKLRFRRAKSKTTSRNADRAVRLPFPCPGFRD